MLSRFSAISSIARKQSVLFRVVSTSANKSNASAPATTNEPRRYPHDAPERDFKNFPPLRQPENGGKLRIGLVPDEWFQAMYNKTGVIGPYVIFWGGITTLLSKEVFVYWPDTAEQIVFLSVVIGLSKVYGKKLGEFLDKRTDELNNQEISRLESTTKEIDAKIQQNEALSSLPEANQLIHAAKRESLLMQLESAFRQRLAQVHQEVKRRLDYQVAIQAVHKRLEREQAINYILGEVNKSIGPNQEKEAFQSGLEQLRSLSKKYAGTI